MRTLNETENSYITELRARLKDVLPPKYDTDFNLHRWMVDADRRSRTCGNVDWAETNLRNHLRYRKALKLDERPVPSMEENPMFINRHQCKPTFHYMPSNNQYLAWMNYDTFDTAGILHKVSTTEMLVQMFWFYENMLEVVNAKEAETGRVGGIYMIMDVKGYEMNPWTVMFASNGTLAQLIEVITYQNYPRLVQTYCVINTPKWLLWPVNVLKSAMPKDFNERFLLFDGRYTDCMLKHMTEDELPKQLGGRNPCSDAIQPVPSRRIPQSEYYQHKTSNDPPRSQLAHVQLHVGQRILIPIRCSAGSTITWFFNTDGDIHFGVYFRQRQDDDGLSSLPGSDGDILDELEMQHPYFRLGAKLVPERGSLECEENGVYYIVLCNKHSWFYKRNVYLKLEVDGKNLDKKNLIESAYTH